MDGPCDASYPSHEDYDDESFACDKPSERAPHTLRWDSQPPESNETPPAIPGHELSSAGSYGGHPSTFRSEHNPATCHRQDPLLISGHSRSMVSSFAPSRSVQTGTVSELTPVTFGGSHTAYSRVSDHGEFGSWMSSMHSSVLHDSGRHPNNNECRPLVDHPKYDTLPRMVRRHSFDSVNILCDSSVGNPSEEDVMSVKSGFTTLMKRDGENDRLPLRPTRRESTGITLH